MAHDYEASDLRVVDLGAVSVETKGIEGGNLDSPSGQGVSGILDD
jgi:hypothetical protein